MRLVGLADAGMEGSVGFISSFLETLSIWDLAGGKNDTMELENRASTASSNPEQLSFVSVSDMVGGKSNEMDRLVGSLARMEGFEYIIS